MPLEDIRRFRQLGSVCAGHPEYGLTPGVECTTGPLSTGAGASVGMAMAGNWLASHFNRPGFEVFDFNVYAVLGDGCMMEGLGSEAASLAGHLRLGNLCWIYDSNQVTIEGPTDLAFSDDVPGRFASYGWQVTHVTDVNDLAALRAAYELAGQDQRPADTDRRRERHRDRRADQAGHRRRAQRAARSRGGPRGQALVRLAGRFDVPGAR